jgi:hypothetical protein
MADLLLAAVVLRRPEHALAAQVLALALHGVVREIRDASPGRPEVPPDPTPAVVPVLEVVDPSRATGHEPDVLVALFGDPCLPGARLRLDPDDAGLRERLRAAAARVTRAARREGYLAAGRGDHLTEKGQAVRADLVALEDTVEREVAEARRRDADRAHVSPGLLPWAVLFGHEPGWVPVDHRSVRADVAAVCAAADALSR